MTRTTLWLVSWCAIVIAVFSSLVEAGWRNAEATVIVIASVVNLLAGAPWRSGATWRRLAGFAQVRMRTRCLHPDFSATVDVNRLEDMGRFMADVRINCASCGRTFRFLGLPVGADLNGAAASPDATEARLAIAPFGDVVSALDGAPQGFAVRRRGAAS